METRARYVRLDGHRVYTVEAGPETPPVHPPLLALHGWLEDHSLWLPHLGLLAREHRVALVDLPGFGASDAPPLPYDLHTFARLLRGLVERLGLERYRLLGHGLGGAVALQLALEDPRVEGLVLASPSYTRNPFLGLRGRLLPSPLGRLALSRLGPRGLRLLLSRHYHAPGHPGPGELRRRLEALRRPGHARAAHRALLTDVDPGLEQRLPALRLPVHLLWGYNDHLHPIDLAHRFAGQVPGTRLLLVPDAGYMGLATRPRSYRDQLARALREQEAGLQGSSGGEVAAAEDRKSA